MALKTLYEKLWSGHVVHEEADGTTLLYIDRHFIHEVSSPQAFEGLRQAGRAPWRSDLNLPMVDHNVPTLDRAAGSRTRGLAPRWRRSCGTARRTASAPSAWTTCVRGSSTWSGPSWARPCRA